MTWRSIADLLGDEGEVALIGAPMEAGSVTPGRCDLAPETVRRALKRLSTYDLDTGQDLDVLRVRDRGDVPVRGLSPAAGFGAIRQAVSAATAEHALTLLLGGNNAVTRPAAHGLNLPLERVGLITLDAHFDMRETDQGPMNGNPVRCLLEDGLPGRNIVQIGLAPFANTQKMHEDALAAGIGYFGIFETLEDGIEPILDDALARLTHVDAIMVDFDIDVIDRAQLPGAPGARPGGMPVNMFFEAARILAMRPQVKLVDLTEFDPSLDVSDISALTAARWVAEVLMGYAMR
ncbi:MAG TPA: agmatinase family protein [Allosphingosinicella sp.]|nr:agmatinase family protein [Allosphingosinicella sp.]